MDFAWLRNQIIGHDTVFETPFGSRLLTYADYAASGRGLYFIEKALQDVQKGYGNPHTEDDYTGGKTTRLLHEAEKTIRRLLNAQDNCHVFPCGSGSTGAILKFQQLLGLYCPPVTREIVSGALSEFADQGKQNQTAIDGLQECIKNNRPVIFFGPYDHHSNNIMWRETGCETVEIDLTPEGQIDLADLENKVSDPVYRHRKKIGTFSAASNVTGLISPVYEIARTLHEQGALACFDFAASGPYVSIDMNRDAQSYFDAVFLSPHKFLGGPGSCGLLVLNHRHYRKELAPSVAAGGTVDYASSFAYDFSEEVAVREQAGTPGVLQIIRAALCLDLKDRIGVGSIKTREAKWTHLAFERFSKNPNIVILGTQEPEKRIGIFSLLIKHGDKYLHARLAARLLNDLFGIQARAGCSCASPYGHRLLQITQRRSSAYREAIQKGCHSVKPGWLRICFHYVMDQAEFDFICQAVDFVAHWGHLFIDEYEVDWRTGAWSHRELEPQAGDESVDLERILGAPPVSVKRQNPMDREQLYQRYIDEAFSLINDRKKSNIIEFNRFCCPEVEELRYFSVQHIKRELTG